MGTHELAMRGTDDAALASVLGALNAATGSGAVSDAKVAMTYLKQLVTLLIAQDVVVDNLHDTDIPAIKTILDTPANFMADVSALALEATLTAIKGGGFGQLKHW